MSTGQTELDGELMSYGSFGEVVRESIIAEIEELRNEVAKVAEGLTDAQLWRRPLEPSNSVGHLILHLTGNLNHFVGAQLGQTGYVRQREREFTETDMPPRNNLLANFDVAVATFRKVVSGLTEEQFLAQHPHQSFGIVLKALLHLLAHFAMHRGQMSYITRLVGSE
jgi:hypothetical protein